MRITILLSVGLVSGIAATQVAGQERTIADRARDNPTSAVVSGVMHDVPTPSIEDLVKGAPLVLEGQLSAEKSYLSADETHILTDYQISPTRVLSGRLSNTTQDKPGETSAFMLVVRGGSWVVDGRVVYDVDHGRERLKTGIPYLLFLEPSKAAPGKYELYATGAFEIRDSRLAAPNPKQSSTKYRDLMAMPYQQVVATVQRAARQKQP